MCRYGCEAEKTCCVKRTPTWGPTTRKKRCRNLDSLREDERDSGKERARARERERESARDREKERGRERGRDREGERERESTATSH